MQNSFDKPLVAQEVPCVLWTSKAHCPVLRNSHHRECTPSSFVERYQAKFLAYKQAKQTCVFFVVNESDEGVKREQGYCSSHS